MTTWDEAELKRLISGRVQERHDLEFKSSGAFAKTNEKRTEITITVSAMANAAGGSAIYGMSETKLHYAKAIEPINAADYPKEWLEQVVNSVQPRIENLRILPVYLGGSASSLAYVMEVPQSRTAHQALDNRYYRRYNFEALPMRHDEIMDVLNRAKVPSLELLVSYRTVSKTSNHHDYTLTLKVANTATVTASHYKLEVTFPHQAFQARADSVYAHPSNTWYDPVLLSRREEGDLVTIIYRSRRPLFPKDTDDITEEVTLRYVVDEKANRIVGEQNPDVSWVIYADNALPKTGRMKVKELSNY